MENKLFYQKKALASYFQIFIMVLSTISFSYLIFCSYTQVFATTISSNQKGCCEKSKSGVYCSDDLLTNCLPESKTSPSSCESASFCKKGCCISNQTGLCSQNTPQFLCSEGEWNDNALCGVQNCKEGCCILGDQAEWVTQKNCEMKSQLKGLPVSFSSEYKSAAQCIFGSEKDKKGACILDDARNCNYITGEECNLKLKIKDQINSNFFVGKYCSDSQLNTTCKKQDHRDCITGKTDVFYFDSCSNEEGIAESCNFLNSKACKKSGTSANCQDIGCNINGKYYKNGESWCEYDGTIGVDSSKNDYGHDVVGSRDIRHICYMGDERIEQCADYRNEICVSDKINTNYGLISQASCRVNDWQNCLNYNSQQENNNLSKCKTNPDCFIKKIDLTKGKGNFKFDVCLPKYPAGFEQRLDVTQITDPNYQSTSETTCSSGNQHCTEIWVKPCIFCSWKCQVNCNCHTPEFTKQLNELCISLGDCGGYANYDGVYTENFGVTASWKSPGKTGPKIDEYKSNAKKNPSQTPASPGDIDYLGKIIPENYGIINQSYNVLAGVTGAFGSSLLIQMMMQGKNTSFDYVTPQPSGLAGFSNAGFQGLITGTAELPDNGMGGIGMGQIIGGVIGAIGALLSSTILIALGAIIALIFFSQTKKNEVYFKCYPWQAPTTGNCEKCNSIESPCTKYRCETLGQNCEFINKGTGNELCVSKSQNESIPQIKPWYGFDNSYPGNGTQYSSISDKGFSVVNSTSKGCIEAYNEIKIGLETTSLDNSLQYTQCKFNTSAQTTFDQMEDFFDELHPASYLPYHVSTVYLPNPEAYKDKYNLSQDDIKKLGEYNLYIICKNRKGTLTTPFEIKFCISPGPDLTAPYIRKIVPDSNTFLKFNQSEKDISIFVNEPSNCKWDKSDLPYSQMHNDFNCDIDLMNMTLTKYGYICNTKLTTLQNSSKIYIRCQDVSNNKNNMTQSFIYDLIPSTSILSITSTRPEINEKILTSSEPVQIELQAETSGGASNGIAFCSWSGNGFSDAFTQTDSTIHKYTWNYGMSGNYNLNYTCIDAGGNTASLTLPFTVLIDKSGPIITRVYNDGGLKITTSETSTCKYGFDNKFIFENGTEMSGDNLDHSTSWVSGASYYIQCKDNLDNLGSIFKVKPY